MISNLKPIIRFIYRSFENLPINQKNKRILINTNEIINKPNEARMLFKL